MEPHCAGNLVNIYQNAHEWTSANRSVPKLKGTVRRKGPEQAQRLLLTMQVRFICQPCSFVEMIHKRQLLLFLLVVKALLRIWEIFYKMA